MELKQRLLGAAVLAGSTLSSPGAIGADTMTGEEIKQLIVGNTIYLEVLEVFGEGFVREIYFDPSGTYQWYRMVEVYENSWQIREGDRLCWYWMTKTRRAYKEDCGVMKNNGDGTYTRIHNGVPIGKVKKVVRGKAF